MAEIPKNRSSRATKTWHWERCKRHQPCSWSVSGWRRAGGCGLQITSSRNVLGDIFLKLGFLVTLLFRLKRATSLLKHNPSLHSTGRVAVSPPEHTVIYSLPHSHRRHKPLRRDCRQHSCQHTRCHSITPHKHPAFTLFVFPPVQAVTAHKHTEGLIYNKSPFFIPRSGKEPWHKCNLLRELRNSSKKNQAHVAFCRQRGAATCKHMCMILHTPANMEGVPHIHIYTHMLFHLYSHT